MKKSIIISNTNDQNLSVFLSARGVTRTFVENLERARKLIKIITKGDDTIFIINCKISKDEASEMLSKKEGVHFIGAAKIIVIENIDNVDRLFKEYLTMMPPAPPVPPIIITEPENINLSEYFEVPKIEAEEVVQVAKKSKKTKKKVYTESNLNQELENDSQTISNGSMVI